MKRRTAKGTVFPLSQYFIFSLCLSLVAGLLVSGGCVTESIVVGDIVFDAGNPVVEVTLHPGESIQLQLEENPSSGYLWLVEPGRNAAETVVIAHSQYLPPETSGALGASGTRRWIFQAVSPGSARYTFSYQRSWDSQNPAAHREVNFLVTAVP